MGAAESNKEGEYGKKMYGKNPSGGDDKTALQDAINVVSARPLTNGIRGALQLGAATNGDISKADATLSGLEDVGRS